MIKCGMSTMHYLPLHSLSVGCGAVSWLHSGHT